MTFLHCFAMAMPGHVMPGRPNSSTHSFIMDGNSNRIHSCISCLMVTRFLWPDKSIKIYLKFGTNVEWMDSHGVYGTFIYNFCPDFIIVQGLHFSFCVVEIKFDFIVFSSDYGIVGFRLKIFFLREIILYYNVLT